MRWGVCRSPMAAAEAMRAARMHARTGTANTTQTTNSCSCQAGVCHFEPGRNVRQG